MAPPDPWRQPTLFLVATSHLDTQWRWTVRDTIRDFLPRTLRENFAAFRNHPSLVLSFEGAFRYMLAEEYYPELFAELRDWVARGRWRPVGSMLDAPDVNIPSPESLIRHVLWGNRYFERTFGRPSHDLFLPDCFGFGWALPTIAAHCGLLGFSSQKFGKWMAPARIPFDLGLWEGPDGRRIVAALRPEGYGEGLAEDLSRAERWRRRIEKTARASGLQAALMYVGVGDRGGALDTSSLDWLEKSAAGEGPVQVRPAASEELFLEVWGEDRRRPDRGLPYELERLPVHRGELLLPTHGTGCLTSKSILKRRNRRCELLAGAAERAAAAADWLGALPYPGAALEAAWVRFLWHQMHDDLTGTSIPAAYRITVNDQVLSLNALGGILTDAVGAVGRALDTRTGGGVPLVVFNPLGRRREDLVDARVRFTGGAPAAVRVRDPEGREVTAQILERSGEELRLLFAARLPATGFAVYAVEPLAGGPPEAETEAETESAPPLEVDPGRIENGRYLARLGAGGDLESLYDKSLGLELLAAPAGLELYADRSRRWPAWEILAEDLAAPPVARFGAPARIEVVERGPVRAAVRIARRAGGSTAVLTYRLAAGAAGDRLEIAAEIDWRSRGRLLKAVFPLAFPTPEAHYDLGLGTIARGANQRKSYEVPAQQWAGQSDPAGRAGVAISNDSRHGWDKPDERTLRLTLARAPGVGRRFRHQGGQDLGPHRVLWALHGHPGDWAEGGVPAAAERLNEAPLAFQVEPGDGPLGRSFSLLEAAPGGVALRALKRAEDGGGLVVRLQETVGRRTRVELATAAPVAAAREVDGVERDLGAAPLAAGRLDAVLDTFEPRAFALELEPPATPVPPPRTTPLLLPHDVVAASFHERDGGGGEVDFDGRRRSLAGELLPAEIRAGGVLFRLAPPEPGRPHCVACHGQRVHLPAAGVGFDALWLLAAAVGGDLTAAFRLGHREHELEVHDWAAPHAAWVRRRELWGLAVLPARPPFAHHRPVAFVGSHRHGRGARDEPHTPWCLYRYRLPLDGEARVVELPRAPRLRLFAATLAAGDGPARPATPLFD